MIIEMSTDNYHKHSLYSNENKLLFWPTIRICSQKINLYSFSFMTCIWKRAENKAVDKTYKDTYIIYKLCKYYVYNFYLMYAKMYILMN